MHTLHNVGGVVHGSVFLVGCVFRASLLGSWSLELGVAAVDAVYGFQDAMGA